jgi:hypothetical protein
MIPTLLHLKIPTEDGYFGLWLPWFLVYVILLALMLVALPFVLLAAIILLPSGRARPLIMAGPCLWRLLFAMRGLRAEIQTGRRQVLVNFI